MQLANRLWRIVGLFDLNLITSARYCLNSFGLNRITLFLKRIIIIITINNNAKIKKRFIAQRFGVVMTPLSRVK